MSDTTPYTKRELDRMFQSLEDKSVERHNDLMVALNALTKQVTTTNGRVGKLELARAYGAGAIAVILIIVIPLGIFAFNAAREVDKAGYQREGVSRQIAENQ